MSAPPAGQTPRWQQAHDVIVTARVGSTVKFEQFGSAMGLDPAKSREKSMILSAVNTAKKSLADKGYAIEAVPRVGYQIMAGPARVRGRRTIIGKAETPVGKKSAKKVAITAPVATVPPVRKGKAKAEPDHRETKLERPKPTKRIPVPAFKEAEVAVVAEAILDEVMSTPTLEQRFDELSSRFDRLQEAHVKQTQELTDATKLVDEVLAGMKEFRVTVVSPWHEGVGKHRPQD